MKQRAIAVALVALAVLPACGQNEEEARSACRSTARRATEMVEELLRAMSIVLRGERANIGPVGTQLERVKADASTCEDFRRDEDAMMRGCAETVTLASRTTDNFLRTVALVPPRNVRLIRAAFQHTVPPNLRRIQRASVACFPSRPSPTP